MSQLEEALLIQIKALALPMPEIDYKFCAVDGWVLRFAWPDKKIAVEIMENND